MTRPRVLVSNIMMINEKPRFDAALRGMGYEPVWASVSQYLDEAACLDLVGSIDGWLAGDDQITLKVLEAALPRLRVISKWGTGLDSIDLDAARNLGVPVFNSPGAFADAVAEVAIGLILMVKRHLASIDRNIRAGEWPKPRGTELRGSTLGMVGYGAIGGRIAELGRAFGMRTIFHDPFREGSVDIGDIAREADIICLACALTPDNHHLINAELLGTMKSDVILINVARGPIVDEAALIEALHSGRVAGAGLDVFEVEPLPFDSRLRVLDNVVLSSHNANNGRHAVEAVHENTLQNLRRVLDGK